MESARLKPCTPHDGLQILISARELIADEKQWTRIARARDVRGIPCEPLDCAAIAFCGEGAVRRASRGFAGCEDLLSMLNASASALYHGTLHHVNDEIGHRAVIHVFDFTINISTPKPNVPAQVIPLDA